MTGEMSNQEPNVLNGMSRTEKVAAWDMKADLVSTGSDASVLDGSGRHTGGDVALGQDQDQRGRQGGHDGGGHDRVPLLVVVADVVVDAEGDRPQIAAAVKGVGEDEVGPGPQEAEQRD